jgi:ABC-2 type transport system permease protein
MRSARREPVTLTDGSAAVAAPAPAPRTATPVGDLSQFWTAFRYQVRSYVRTWRFLGLLIFVALVSTIILSVQLYRGVDYITTTFATSSDYLSTYLGYLADAVIITAAFLGGDALAVDLGGGPGYLMLTQPVRRGSLLFGRYAAAAVVGVAIALVYYAFAIGASLYFFGNVPVALALSVGLAILFGLATLAVAFFFSSFFRTPVVSIIASLLILILGFPIMTEVGDLAGFEPWFSLDYGSGVITNVLSSNFVHESVMKIGGTGRRGISITLYTWSPYLWEGVVIMLGYLVAFLVVCFVIYRYREVKA